MLTQVLDMSNGEGEQWMLIDTVGGLFTGGLKYFLKHRMAGQEESTVLGAAEIHGSDTEFEYKITDTDVDVDWDSDPDDFSDDGASDDEFDADLEIKQKLKAKWKLRKECNLYSDYEMTNKLGKLKVKAKGKYKRKTKIEIDWQTDEEGKRHKVERVNVKHKTKPVALILKQPPTLFLSTIRNRPNCQNYCYGHQKTLFNKNCILIWILDKGISSPGAK